MFCLKQKKYALLRLPIMQLREILQRKTIADLKDLTKMLPFKNDSSLRKTKWMDAAEINAFISRQNGRCLTLHPSQRMVFFLGTAIADILQDDHIDRWAYLSCRCVYW